MKIEKKKLTDIIDNELKEFSMYTIESRAIPSAIDGLKPTQRKLIYAMLNEYGGKKVKLSDLGGISKFNYHHGEASAIGAAVAMSQDWSNNQPLFEGHGNFGSRLVQEAAAPRYIFASLSPSFKKFFIDEEVAPDAFDSENPEPAFYLPTIPWILVNGISGIAVGFKTEILPRSIKDVVASTKDCLKNSSAFLKANKPIAPTFPHFKGKVEQISDNQWKSCGVIEYIGKNYFKISELPVGYDRETYVEFLNTLIDKDLIRDYDDVCSKEGFGFEVKVSLQQKMDIEKDPMKYFKLEKTHTEILTTLGYDGKLKVFQSVAQLIHYFVEYRLGKFNDKIEYDKAKLKQEIKELVYRIKFIQLILTNEIDFLSTSKSQLLDIIADKVCAEDFAKKFISIPLYECTTDEVKELKDKCRQKKEKLDQIDSLTPESLYSSILKGL